MYDQDTRYIAVHVSFSDLALSEYMYHEHHELCVYRMAENLAGIKFGGLALKALNCIWRIASCVCVCQCVCVCVCVCVWVCVILYVHVHVYM